MMILAQTMPIDPSYLTEITSTGALIGAFFFLFRWFLKSMTAQLKSISLSISASSLVITDLHSTILHHDARVRGINPSVGDDADPGHKEAIEEYKRVLDQLDRTNLSIGKLIEKAEKVA